MRDRIRGLLYLALEYYGNNKNNNKSTVSALQPYKKKMVDFLIVDRGY
jgi:hypothetical protein